MYFTQEDYRKIEAYLKSKAARDTSFDSATTPLQGNETIVLVQGGKNVNTTVSDIVSQFFALGVSDFINVTDKYGISYNTLDEAIRVIPWRSRKVGQVITFLNEQGEWHLYQYQGESILTWNNTTLWVDLLESRIVNSILPDQEDLTMTEPDADGNSYMHFKNKDYSIDDFSGLGRVYLRKNLQTLTDPNTGETRLINYLTQTMVGKENVIYHIQYDYNLNGQTIIIPEGCVLLFEGGSISNGVLHFTNTLLAGTYNDFNYGIEGSIRNETLYVKSILGSSIPNLISAVSYCIVYLPAGTFNISSNIKVNSGTTIIGDNTELSIGRNFISNKAVPKRSNQYYTPLEGNTQIKITTAATKGDSNLILESVTTLKVGDKLLIQNGYCDMWRVMETYSKVEEWVDENVELWNAQTSTIVSINAVSNTITLDTPLKFDLPIPPKTYGFFDDENDLPYYEGYNTPTVERILQNADITIKNLKVIGDSSTPDDTTSGGYIFFSGVTNAVVDNCTISSHRGVLLDSCYDSVIRNCYIKSTGYSISLNRVCENNIVEGNHCVSSTRGDSVILVMANGSFNNIINNICYKKDDIGIYINTSHCNFVNNNILYDCGTAVAINFSFGKNVANNNIAYGCNIIYKSAYSQGDSFIGGTLQGILAQSTTAYTELSIAVIDSYNIVFENIQTNTNNALGRVHLYRCFNVNINNCDINSFLWYSANDSLKVKPEEPKINSTNSSFTGIYLFGSSTWDDVSQRKCYFSNCNFKGTDNNKFQKLYYSVFINCKFESENNIGLEFDGGAYNKFIECTFKGKDYDIKFGQADIRNLVSSLQLFRDCVFTFEKLLGYDTLAYLTLKANPVPTNGTGEVSLLKEYPRVTECIFDKDSWVIKTPYMSPNMTPLTDQNLTSRDKGVLAIRQDNRVNNWNGEEWLNEDGTLTSKVVIV